MRHLITLLLTVSLTAPLAAQDTLRVLFLGNSYTAYNDLPRLTSRLAASAGDSLAVDRNTPGGFTLEGHTTNTASQNLIAASGWDVVVLQEQSQRPSFPDGQVATEVVPYAEELIDSIRAVDACTQPMFYMTWGRENGDASNCAAWPPVCTYEGMDSLLRLRYLQMADSFEAEVSPVGVVWRALRRNHPAIDLYTSDGSHPSFAGSYAAAVTFYTVLFRADPTGITRNESLSAADAEAIRQTVKSVVFDSLDRSFVGAYDPVADFALVSIPIRGSAELSSLSLRADSLSWIWEDGFVQTGNTIFRDLNGVIPDGAFIDLTLEAWRCGRMSSFSRNLFVWGSLRDVPSLEPGALSPVPVRSRLTIDLPDVESAHLISVDGRRMSVPTRSRGDRAELDMTQIPGGMYTVIVQTADGPMAGRVIKR